MYHMPTRKVQHPKEKFLIRSSVAEMLVGISAVNITDFMPIQNIQKLEMKDACF